MLEKKITKIFLIIIFSFYFTVPVFAQPLLDSDTVSKMTDQTEQARTHSGFQFLHIGDVISLVIKAFLSILALLFIILVILGGYYWMTAEGDETKMTKAKDTLKKAIIGLIIIVSAYAITAFVFKALDQTVGGHTSPPSGSSGG